MNIHQIHKNWTDLGAEDPLWAVLTDPAKKGNKWDENEFFETGRREIDAVLAKLLGMGLSIPSGRALDFGCGPGRLTRALGAHFKAVDGVDVSASMIEKANALNQMPGKVEYHLNLKGDLSGFQPETYDFIYSNICLHHIPAAFQINYISEFARVLKTGGFAYFQTTHARGWRRLIPDWFADAYRKIKNRGKSCIALYGMPRKRVIAAFERENGRLLNLESSPYAGWESRFVGDIYLFTKRPSAGQRTGA